MFFRGDPTVAANFHRYIREYSQINLSIVTYYEILSGLKHRDAQKQLSSFLRFTEQNAVLPLTQASVTISAELYANLRSQGTPVDDIDLLIAGIAIAENLVLITHNLRHFGRIERLECQDWSRN